MLFPFGQTISLRNLGLEKYIMGRDLLIQDLRWRVGNGESIHIADDWIPGMPNPIRYNDIAISYLSLKVSDLYDASRVWRRSLLSLIFPNQTVDAITSIHVPFNQQEDKRIWSLESNGSYSIKSA